MARPSFSEAQREEIRREILDAAHELFIEHGFEGVSIRRIGKRVGCSPMRIYHYFRNKYELLHFIWETIFDELFEYLDVRLAGVVGPENRLRAFSEAFVEHWVEHPEEYKVVYLVQDEKASPEGDYFVYSRDTVSRFEQRLGQILRDGVEDGSFPGATGSTATSLIAALTGICHLLVTVPQFEWPKDMLEGFLSPFLRGLRTTS